MLCCRLPCLHQVTSDQIPLELQEVTGTTDGRPDGHHSSTSTSSNAGSETQLDTASQGQLDHSSASSPSRPSGPEDPLLQNEAQSAAEAPPAEAPPLPEAAEALAVS